MVGEECAGLPMLVDVLYLISVGTCGAVGSTSSLTLDSEIDGRLRIVMLMLALTTKVSNLQLPRVEEFC